MNFRNYASFAAMTLLMIFASPAHAADGLFFASVGSGGLDGGYNRTTRVICNAVHEAARKSVRCSPEVTAGSIYNLKGLANEELEFAMVQSDWLHAAYTGTSLFASSGPNEDLRTVTGLYIEAFTLLTRRAAEITNFLDLKGKRVDIGSPTSGRRATMEVAMQAFGVKKSDFSHALELPSSHILQSLCEGSIDAVALVVGHPSPMIAKAIADCDAELISVGGSEVSKLISEAPYYSKARLPARLYQGQHIPISTFGVTATLVTTSKVPAKIVEIVAATISRDWDLLRKFEPIMANATLLEIQSNDKTAPLHAGAAAVFEK